MDGVAGFDVLLKRVLRGCDHSIVGVGLVP